jgi:hypothetical protein
MSLVWQNISVIVNLDFHKMVCVAPVITPNKKVVYFEEMMSQNSGNKH